MFQREKNLISYLMYLCDLHRFSYQTELVSVPWVLETPYTKITLYTIKVIDKTPVLEKMGYFSEN